MTTGPAASIPAALALAYDNLVGGRLHDAEVLCRQILGMNPREPDALHCLSLVAYQTGRLDAAIELIRAAIASSPPTAHYLNDLGTMLRAQGSVEGAITSYRQALNLEPSRADVHYNLANALRGERDLPGAVASYQAAIEVQPDFIDAHFHLGNVLAEQGLAEAAASQFANVISMHPDHAGAYYNLANARADQGRLDEAVTGYRRALDIEPGFSQARSNLLWTLQYMDEVSEETAFAEARRFADIHEAPLRSHWMPHDNQPDPSRRLKVGYVSADFRRHSVAYFAEPLLQNHDRSQIEIFCYYNNDAVDAVTQRLMALADHWIPCRGLDDDALAARIRRDGIDILVDLAGHTAHHRLLVFVRKPAPVQVTYLGYPATTGLSAVDYRITDIHADPPGSGDAMHSEKLIRLPGTFLTYRPPENAIDVQSTPARRNGYVTFGSFNALPKLTPRVIETWARILTLVPHARILLKAAGFEHVDTRKRFTQKFESQGIEVGRLTIIGKDAGFEEHLARYHDIDIALDPFPYNGTTTTLEAMWMGVPTVTLCGNRHATRVGASLLRNAGLVDYIAPDDASYVQIAARAASDFASLDALRLGMRPRMLNSVLLDSAALAGDVELAYRQIWQSWCEQPR